MALIPQYNHKYRFATNRMIGFVLIQSLKQEKDVRDQALCHDLTNRWIGLTHGVAYL